MTDLRALLTRAGEVLANAIEAIERGSTTAPVAECLRALHAEITAALANAPNDEWRDIASAPTDGRFCFYGLHCRNRGGMEWFEAYYLQLDDDGQLLEQSGDPFSTWSYDDFKVWAPAPAPPPERRETTPAVTEEMVERFLRHWYPTINEETLALMKVNGTYKVTQDGLTAALRHDSDSSDK